LWAVAVSTAFAKDEIFVSNPPASPVPVTVISPANQFSLSPVQLTLTYQGAFAAPDPSGTRYAITSVTVSNPLVTHVNVAFRAYAVEYASPTCRNMANAQNFSDGPEITVSPFSTTHITFSQPFITGAVTGTFVCLAAVGLNTAQTGMKWSAVGYKLNP
jgi:hypothetical protein